jgi:hypothetical protein
VTANRGSSCATPECRPACRELASSRGGADGSLNACGSHIGRCRACDGRWAAGAIAGCPATQRCWPASPPTRGPMSTSTVTSSLVGGYRARPEPLTLISRLAKSVKLLRSRTLWRLSVEDTLLQGLAQDFENMAAELGPFIQEEHAIMGQRHVARHRHGAPTNQPHIRDGVVGRTTRASRDPRRAIPREASDAREVGGVDRCGQAR